MAGHSPVAPSSTSGDGGSHGGLTTNKNLAVKRGTEIRQKNHGMGKRFQTIALSVIFLVALLTFGYTYRGWIPGTYNDGIQTAAQTTTANMQENVLTPHKNAPVICGKSRQYEISSEKPFIKLQAKTGEVLLGCGMNWQRSTGPKIFFSIDGGKWYSWDYSEVYGNSVPPVANSIAFKMAQGENGKTIILVNYPKP